MESTRRRRRLLSLSLTVGKDNVRKQSIKQKAAQLVAMFIFTTVRALFFEMTACWSHDVRIKHDKYQ